MSTDELSDFGCTKNELIEAVHAGANRDDVARIEGAVWRLFDRVSGLRYFMDARTSLLAELEDEKRQNRAAALRLAELERENARLRELLSETMMDIAIFEDVGHIRARAMERRAALAGSGEK
jgi:hypothetical protein